MKLDQSAGPRPGVGGSQTLMRGLDVIEAVARGATSLVRLAEHLGLTRSTTHRLAASLVERGYLAYKPRTGYRLGAKLLTLGHLAQEQAGLVQVARPHLEVLAARTDDTVHFGVLDDGSALYLDKMPGRRRITIASRVGDRHPLTSTGLGKALMLSHMQEFWVTQLERELPEGVTADERDQWLARMHGYVAAGVAFDLGENEDHVRCVAAPVRNAAGAVVAALSLSSAAQYMDDERMRTLAGVVRDAARAVSRDLGWSEEEMSVAA